MSIEHWPGIAERLCRLVAGDDLDGKPVYLVSYSEIRQQSPGLCAQQFAGWTCGSLDLALSGYLKDCGQWRGRGFACLIDEQRFDSPQGLLGSCLHELSHHIDAQPQATIDDCPAWLAQGLLHHATEALSSPIASDVPPWAGHEQGFVRAASHLAYRANEIFESVRPRHLAFGRAYFGAWGSEFQWMRVLGDELNYSGPIRDIIATDPPAAFTELWDECTSWYEQARVR